MGKKSRMKAERRIARENDKTNAELHPNAPRLPPRVKDDKYLPKGPNDLFDNPMARAAMAALTEEEKAKYKRIGEHLYGRIDFETGINMAPDMAEAVAYLESQLRAGLHPSMLEDNEKEIIKEAYGEDWYVKWGYVEEDLDDIVTLVHYNS